MQWRLMLDAWKEVFGNWKYLMGVLIIALAFYSFNVLISSWKSLIGFYSTLGFFETIKFFFILFIGFREIVQFHSFISLIIISILFGINLSLVLYKYSLFSSLEGKGFLGFVGSGIGAFGFGCPTCGAFLFGLIGMPLALTYLPFKGLELRVLSILILAVSIHLTAKSIKSSCKIEIKQKTIKTFK